MKYRGKFLSKYKDDVWDLNIQILEWQNNLHIKSFENMQNVGAQTNSGRNRIGANRLRVNHAPVPHSNNTYPDSPCWIRVCIYWFWVQCIRTMHYEPFYQKKYDFIIKFFLLYSYRAYLETELCTKTTQLFYRCWPIVLMIYNSPFGI